MNRTEALERVQKNPLLSQVYTLEQEQLLSIIDFALSCTEPACKPVYSDTLEQMAEKITGKKAKHHDLRSPAHQEVLLAFIDWLLPDMPEEDVEEEIYDAGDYLVIEDRNNVFL
jgi:hypothetical protein